MAEQATKGQRLLLIPGRASKRSRWSCPWGLP